MGVDNLPLFIFVKILDKYLVLVYISSMDELNVNVYLILSICLICFLGLVFEPYKSYEHPKRYDDYVKAMQNCTNKYANLNEVDYCRAEVTLYYKEHEREY